MWTNWTTLKKLIWLRRSGAGGGRGIFTTVRGTSPLTLANAVKAKIKSLVQYGKCSVSGSDITCNNGTLSYGVIGKNLFPYETIAQYSYAWYSGSKNLSDAVYPILLKGGNDYSLSYASDESDVKPLIRAWKTDGTILDNEPNTINVRMADSQNKFGWQDTPKYYSGSSISNANSVVISPTIDLWIDMRIASGKQSPTNVMLNLGSEALPYEPYQEGIITTGTPEEIVVSAGDTDYTGSVISIDADENTIVTDLKAYFEPVQDLHGYENPWPAGGGKNILPFVGHEEVRRGVTVSYDEENELYILDGTVDTAGDNILSYIPSGDIPIQEDPAGCYILSVSVVSGTMTIAEGTGITFAVALFSSDTSQYIRGDTSGTQIDGYVARTTTGKSSPGDWKLLLQCWRVGTVFDNLKIHIQIENGATASSNPTSWTPYSNECSITGWTGANVWRTGANLLDQSNPAFGHMTVINGVYSNTNTDSRSYFNAAIRFVYTDNTFTQEIIGQITTAGEYSKAITATKDIAKILVLHSGSQRNFSAQFTESRKAGTYTFSFKVTKADPTIVGGVEFTNLQLTYGTTAPTAYELYSGTTYLITFTVNGETKTIYGGFISIGEDGNCSVMGNRALDTIDGTQPLSGNGSQAYGGLQVRYIPTLNKKPAPSTATQNEGLISDKFKSIAYTSLPYEMTGRSTNGYIYLDMPADVTTVEQAKTWFSNNPTQVSYLLAEPLEFNLSDVTIALLPGENNLWSTANGNLTMHIAQHYLTAHAENLYAVDDLRDEQDIVTGRVIRRTEAVVSDGTTPSGRYIGDPTAGNVIVKALETVYKDDIVSFDSDEEVPLNFVKAEFLPVQDLHGYDYPWPAGGGKNKLAIDTVVHEADTAEIILWEGELTGTYTLSAVVDDVTTDLPNAAMLRCIIDGSQTMCVNKSTHSYTFTGTITKVSAVAATNYSKWTGTAKFQMEEGSTATAWVPYENLCPISGWNEVDIDRTGENLFNPIPLGGQHWTASAGTNIADIVRDLSSFANDTITIPSHSAWQGNTFFAGKLDIGKTYKLTGTLSADVANQVRCTVFTTDSDYKVVRTIKYFYLSTEVDESITIASGEAYIAFSMTAADTSAVKFENPTVSESGTYTPYHGETIPIKFGPLGKNLLPQQLEYAATVDALLTRGIFLKQGEYTLSFASSTATSWRFAIAVVDESGRNIGDGNEITGIDWRSGSGIYLNAANISTKYLTITIKTDGYYAFGIMFGDASASTRFANSQLETGSSATTYEPYNDTVYGGYLRINRDGSCDLIGTQKKAVMGSNLQRINTWYSTDINNQSWGAYLNQGNDIKQIITDTIVGKDFISDTLKDVGASYGNRPAWVGGITQSNGAFQYFGIRLSKEVIGEVSSEAELKTAIFTYLSANPIELVFVIEPITYHLPSISALKTYIGRNNIWANTNEDTTVAVSEDEVIEQVTPQKLTIVPGTNTIAWTAEVDGKEMSVTYSKEKEP